jgi:two-component system response regulator RegX3
VIGAGSDNARLLVVAHNDRDREELATVLGSEGYAVMAEATIAGGLVRLRETAVDIVLLDLASPKTTCFDVCRQIQAISDVPIILISSEHDEVGVASALEQCATDYITKPIRARELIARIRAVLRRTHPEDSSASGRSHDGVTQDEPTIVVGPIVIHPSARRVVVNGQVKELSRRDFDLLVLLASPPGKMRTRTELIDRIWSDRELSDTRTLDKHIRRLRTRIEPEAKRPRYLVTVHGVGFRLSDPASGRG